jgi:rRNA maturation RNase YbeY
MRALTRHLLERAAATHGHRWGEVELTLTDDARIRAVKLAVFGLDITTDVVSLAYAPIPGQPGEGGTDGELFVNAALARRRGDRSKRKAWGAEQELALYLAHACDHLSGEDDADEAGRQRMRRRELRWVHAADEAGLLAGLFMDDQTESDG